MLYNILNFLQCRSILRTEGPKIIYGVFLFNRMLEKLATFHNITMNKYVGLKKKNDIKDYFYSQVRRTLDKMYNSKPR